MGGDGGLLHPHAGLETLLAVDRVLSADELVSVIQNATAHDMYSVRAWQVEALALRAAVAGSRVRYRVGAGGFTDEPRVFLATEAAGLIRRIRIFRDRVSALETLHKHDLDLGL